jgi:hypothetical protein
MAPIFFLRLQNLNDNLHFALQRTNKLFFLFMQSYLWSSSMIGMASTMVVVCMWGVVGAGNLCYIGQGSLKN